MAGNNDRHEGRRETVRGQKKVMILKEFYAAVGVLLLLLLLRLSLLSVRVGVRASVRAKKGWNRKQKRWCAVCVCSVKTNRQRTRFTRVAKNRAKQEMEKFYWSRAQNWAQSVSHY
jgi:hypothetical protein